MLPKLKKSLPVYAKRLLAPKELSQESDQNNFFFHKSLPVHTKPLLLVVKSLWHFPAKLEVLASGVWGSGATLECSHIGVLPHWSAHK